MQSQQGQNKQRHTKETAQIAPNRRKILFYCSALANKNKSHCNEQLIQNCVFYKYGGKIKHRNRTKKKAQRRRNNGEKLRISRSFQFKSNLIDLKWFYFYTFICSIFFLFGFYFIFLSVIKDQFADLHKRNQTNTGTHRHTHKGNGVYSLEF